MKTVTSKAEVPITGLILAYNEKDKISKTIEHLMPRVSEVIVFDSQSDDGTVQIAEKCGARVIDTEWNNDFALARNNAMKHVKTEWTLFCDADESFSPDFFNLLPTLVMQNEIKAFFAWRVSVFDGQNVGEEFQPRLMKTREVVWNGQVHESIVAEGEISYLPKQFFLNHCHSFNRQRWNNLMYKWQKEGKGRPPANRGAEMRGSVWEEFDNDRNK